MNIMWFFKIEHETLIENSVMFSKYIEGTWTDVIFENWTIGVYNGVGNKVVGSFTIFYLKLNIFYLSIIA